MSLFNQLGGQTTGNPPEIRQNQAAQNPMQMLQQLKGNPAAFMKQAGYNIPEGMTDPQKIAQHLMSSGQVTNQRLQQAQQMLQKMGRLR